MSGSLLVLIAALGVAAGDMASTLASFKGQYQLSCSTICSVKGGWYQGFSWSSSGSETTYECYCSSGKVTIACEGYPYSQCCEGSCAPAPAPAAPAPAPAPAPDMAATLATFKGKTQVSCSSVCSVNGGSYQGFSWSSAGSETTYDCYCSSGQVTVECQGYPYTNCCEGTCVGGEPPAETDASSLDGGSPSPAGAAPAPAPAGECQSTAKGWSCPADGGCAGGGCTGDFQDWVAAHNVYRCMHNVPAVSWSQAVSQDAYNHFANMAYMSHSDSYKVAPPAGPAGENLFYHSPPHNAADAALMWYDEIKQCPSFPGCKGWSTGHFTAMMWQGVTEIGCVSNPHNIVACRYKGADSLGCTTPNFGYDDTYAQNVYPRVKTYTECKAAVEACGFTVETPANKPYVDGTTGLYESGVQQTAGRLPAYILPSLIVLVAVAAGVATLMLRRRQAARAAMAATSTDEGLE